MRYSDDDLRQSRQKKPNIQGKVPPAEFGTHKEDRDMQEPTRIAGTPSLIPRTPVQELAKLPSIASSPTPSLAVITRSPPSRVRRRCSLQDNYSIHCSLQDNYNIQSLNSRHRNRPSLNVRASSHTSNRSTRCSPLPERKNDYTVQPVVPLVSFRAPSEANAYPTKSHPGTNISKLGADESGKRIVGRKTSNSRGPYKRYSDRRYFGWDSDNEDEPFDFDERLSTASSTCSALSKSYLNCCGISEDEKECELCRLGNIYDESGKNHRGSGSSSHPSGMEHCKTVDDYTKRL